MIYANFRSTCSLGIIASFVLFLASSAPHRVHHFFENLPYASKVLQQRIHKNAGDDLVSLRPTNPSGEAGEEDKHSHDHFGGHGFLNHDRGHHHKYASYDHNDGYDHDYPKREDSSPKSQTVNSSHADDDLPLSAAPLHANTPHNNAHHDGTAHTVCLLQGAAQHAHLSDAQLAEIAFLGIESKKRSTVLLLGFSLFNPSPFSQRAPPKV